MDATTTSVSSVRLAAAIAADMEQIKDIYGEECLSFVQRYTNSSSKPWGEALESALDQWIRTHPTLTADEIADLQALGAI